MRKLLTLTLLLLFIGCKQKIKSPIEYRFERFIQAENLSYDFVQIDSIVLLDSVNLSAHYGELISHNDSLKKALLSEISWLTSNLDNLKYERDAVTILNLSLKEFNVADEDEEIGTPIKEKISIVLEDIPESKSWYTTYKIVANFKSGQRTYYANNLAFDDTITISSERVGGQTLKGKRLVKYFVDYQVKVLAPKELLLDEIKEFSAQIKFK